MGNCNSTLDSEVGILGYLSFAHETDLKYAFREMLEVSAGGRAAGHQVRIRHHMFSAALQAVLTPQTTPANASPMSSTIPYLMHLSSMSEILLQPIVQVFLELCKPRICPNNRQHSLIHSHAQLCS